MRRQTLGVDRHASEATHHALDVDEVARWAEEKTLEIFSTAVASAILDFKR